MDTLLRVFKNVFISVNAGLALVETVWYIMFCIFKYAGCLRSLDSEKCQRMMIGICTGPITLSLWRG